jgi:hypothetical protein
VQSFFLGRYYFGEGFRISLKVVNEWEKTKNIQSIKTKSFRERSLFVSATWGYIVSEQNIEASVLNYASSPVRSLDSMLEYFSQSNHSQGDDILKKLNLYNQEMIRYFWKKSGGVFQHLAISADLLYSRYQEKLAKGSNKTLKILCSEGPAHFVDGPKFFTAHRLAILLLEKGMPEGAFIIDVIDTCKADLEQADLGIYPKAWFDEKDSHPQDEIIFRKYFENRGDLYQLKDIVRDRIHISSGSSLMDHEIIKGAGRKYDLITYLYKEYLLERDLDLQEVIATHVFAAELIGRLKNRGRLLTTANKWFDESSLVQRMQIKTTSHIRLTNIGRMENEVYAYEKIFSRYDDNFFDWKFNNQIEKLYELEIKLGQEIATDLFRQAYPVARKLHRGVTRKNGEPYLIHPTTVVDIFIHIIENYPYYRQVLGLDNVQLDACFAALILHDVVEDYDYARGNMDREQLAEFIADRTSRQVLEMVLELTLPEGDSEEEYLRHIRQDCSLIIALFKLIDKLHNLKTPFYDKSVQKQKESLLVTMKFIKDSDLPKKVPDIVSYFLGQIRRLYWPEIVKSKEEGFIKDNNNLNTGSSPLSAKKKKAGWFDGLFSFKLPTGIREGL